MRLSSGNILGIALSERSLRVVELSVRGDRRTLRKTVTLDFDAEKSLEYPAALGAALAAELNTAGVSASRVVVGVPAKWIIAADRDVPPAKSDQVRALLRMQAERQSAAEGGEMIYDYVGEAPITGGKVLMVAMLRKQLLRIEQVMDAAKLSIVAIVPTSLALAEVAQRQPLLMLSGNGAEVVVGPNGSPRGLRHVSLAANGNGLPALAPLGLELRRTVAMSGSGNGELLLFDTLGLSALQVTELGERIGMKVRGGQELISLGMTETSEAARRYAPAAALALLGAARQMPIDFSHSKLTPPPKQRFGRKTVWLGAAAALIVLGGAGLWFNNHVLAGNLEQINADQRALAPSLALAQAVQDRVDFSNGFLRTRTPMLAALRDVTEAFRDEEPIWATSFNVGEDRDSKSMGKALARLEGKTTRYDYALQLADRLRQNPRLSNVSVRDVSGAGGRQRDLSSFSITFSYTQPK